jgi:hypothetical protein
MSLATPSKQGYQQFENTAWLNRRSQKGTLTGNKLEQWRAYFPLPTPRIVHNI